MAACTRIASNAMRRSLSIFLSSLTFQDHLKYRLIKDVIHINPRNNVTMYYSVRTGDQRRIFRVLRTEAMEKKDV